MKRVVRNGFDSLADDHLFDLALVLTPRRAKHISLAADGQGTSEVSVHFISWLLFSVPPQVPLSTTVSLLLIAQAVSTMPSGRALSSMRAANRMDRIRFFTETPLFFLISAGMCRQVITTIEYTCFRVISISWLHSISLISYFSDKEQKKEDCPGQSSFFVA